MSSVSAGESFALSKEHKARVNVINELIERVKLERIKYNEYMIIKDVAFKCAKEDCDLSAETQTKLYNTLMAFEVESSMELKSHCTLFGLTTFDVPELTYEEKHQIRNVVQREINKKSRKIALELEKSGIDCNCEGGFNRTPFSLCKEDKVLFEFKEELKCKQELYVLKLEELIAVLEDMIKLKTKNLPCLAKEKINVYEIKLRLYNLQTEVLNAKLRANVFTETDASMEAYKELQKNVLQQQTECKEEINELEEMKEKYKQVSCKQFNEILQSYTQYKINMERRKYWYNKIQGKKFDFKVTTM